MSTIELFGGLRICVGGRAVAELPPQGPGLLLAYLALNPHSAFTSAELIDSLWPGVDSQTGRKVLLQSVRLLRMELKQRFGGDLEPISLSPDRIGLNRDAVRVDVTKFEQALRAASSALFTEGRIRCLSTAVALYRGGLLPGFEGELFESERRRLADLFRIALKALADEYRQTGDADRALEVARRRLAIDPSDEEARGDLTRLLAAASVSESDSGGTATGDGQASVPAFAFLEPAPAPGAALNRIAREHESRPGSGSEHGRAVRPIALAAALLVASTVAVVAATQHRHPAGGPGAPAASVALHSGTISARPCMLALPTTAVAAPRR
jgi:DNA-binding SARP family transcriptional activator